MLAYRAAFAVEKTVEWEPGQFSRSADLEEAKTLAFSQVKDLKADLSADKVTICLSDPSRRYWRHSVDPTYKSHRKGGSPPMVLEPLREWMRTRPSAKWFPGLEGDDVAGILATCRSGDRRIIVSIDKDFKQVPGLLYNPSKPDDGVVEITPEGGDLWHLTQTLVGDKTDGYPGCPGVGPVKAAKIVAGGWPAVVEAFVAAGLDETAALVQARLSRILRASDWNFKTKEVVLWKPVTSG